MELVLLIYQINDNGSQSVLLKDDELPKSELTEKKISNQVNDLIIQYLDIHPNWVTPQLQGLFYDEVNYVMYKVLVDKNTPHKGKFINVLEIMDNQLIPTKTKNRVRKGYYGF